MTPTLRVVAAFAVGVAGTAATLVVLDPPPHRPSTGWPPTPMTTVPDAATPVRVVRPTTTTSTTTTTVAATSARAVPSPAVAVPARTDTTASGPATGPPATDTPDDDLKHDHDHGPVDDAATVAAAVAVARFTWRHDDDPDRTARTVGELVADDVLVQLTVTPAELARRRREREVSWAVVVDRHVDGERHRLELRHHSVSDTTPETVETRLVEATVVDGLVVELAGQAAR